MKFFDFFLKKNSSHIEGIEIRRSLRRTRTVSLKIKNGKAIIFCPNFVNDNYLRDIILKKKNWIQNKLKQKINVIELSETKKFPILGKNYKIRFLESKKNEVKVIGDSIRISCSTKKKMKSIFISWLKNQSKNYLKRRLSKLSDRIKIDFQSLFVKTYKARWGCCNSSSEIFLNWKLILLPKRIVDYVIIHELAHILVPNHSKRFWLAVAELDPNYVEKKDWLKENGNNYIRFNE